MALCSADTFTTRCWAAVPLFTKLNPTHPCFSQNNRTPKHTKTAIPRTTGSPTPNIMTESRINDTSDIDEAGNPKSATEAQYSIVDTASMAHSSSFDEPASTTPIDKKHEPAIAPSTSNTLGKRRRLSEETSTPVKQQQLDDINDTPTPAAKKKAPIVKKGIARPVKRLKNGQDAPTARALKAASTRIARADRVAKRANAKRLKRSTDDGMGGT
ncbi:hypothetical protein LTR37_008428 [Vermiconidia calcicola]|uniref:Uncharacterized protein n=1 Tax=Vermiconidia calcicola TaxID=1690605 RepID=A0ACC3NAH5_9PEZI|nr:hypothetical protein LTR37_008428 [Vermiconidia calcicola]